MNRLSRSCLSATVLLAALAGTSPALAQLQPQSELLRRLWPFGRQQLRPVPLLPPERLPSDEDSERRPLVAPFVPRLVDINNCTLAQLQNLPGVNASTAARILAGRPYRNYQDLERDGIPLSVVARLRGKITFGP